MACTNGYGTKDAHYQINELRLQSNELSSSGNAHSVGRGNSQLGTLAVWLTQEPKTDCLTGA